MAERRTSPPPPKTYNSLVASAAVLTGSRKGAKIGRAQDWQTELWDLYDEIGEYRAGIGWLANAMSRVNLVAATAPQNQGEEPGIIKLPEDEGTQTPALDGTDGTDDTPVSEIDAMCAELVAAIAGGVDGQGQLLHSCAVQLEVPGVGYIMMEPDLPAPAEPGPQVVTLDAPPVPLSVVKPTPDETWKWCVLSQDEIKQEGDVYHVQEEDSQWRPLPPEAIVIKVWNSHPRKKWVADSPSRACITVLRQIHMLDQHVEANGDSRLAGAGLLIMPSEATFPPAPRPVGSTAPVRSGLDDFTDTMVQTMELAKRDRGSPSASVPLTIQIPGEYVDKVRHITFWSEFSGQVLPLRESNVKRLALTLDMPPEALLGIGDVNHWGAWAVTEEGITLHIEPMSERICHGLTIGYLRPALEAMNRFDPAEIASKLVWYQTVDLAARPDRSGVSKDLYDRYELSGDALRRESGLNEEDRPDDAEKQLRILLAMAMADPKAGPAILSAAGILDAKIAEVAPAPVPTEPGPPPGGPPSPPDNQPVQGPPQTKDNPPPPPADGPPAASGLMEAADGLVFRALERAGARLRSAAGRSGRGGAAAIACPDPTRLHVDIRATDFAKLDELLAGSWDRAPLIAERLGLDSETFVQALDTYTRALLATGHAHDCDRLADALGLHATV